jgi:hypothetical protein
MTSVQTPQGPGKEVDIALLVFIERYANDLLKWDLISFFAHNQPCWYLSSDMPTTC